jgi:hypothetical protein
MSYTVVVDEQERERRLENRLNAVARHCKIGKVRYKREIGYDWLTAPLPKKRDTFFIDTLPWVSQPTTGDVPLRGWYSTCDA